MVTSINRLELIKIIGFWLGFLLKWHTNIRGLFDANGILLEGQ